MGVSRSALFGWLARYRSGGWDALRAGKRGGRRPKLDRSMMQWVYEAVTEGEPQQLKFPSALWTCPILAEAIYRRFRVRLSRWSVMRLLHQLGLSPQRPLWRAYQQKDEAVREWKKKIYPGIVREAKAAGATIYFADESSIRSDYHSGTTWAPRGSTPVVQTTGARFSVNMLAAITAKGLMRFMTYQGTLDASLFQDFLSRLSTDSKRPVFVIVDGHPVHRSKAVHDFVDASDGRIRLFYLPGYSPELNPTEQAWNHAKRHNAGKQVVSGPDQFRRLVRSALCRLQKLPNLIQSFFRHPECTYAAA